MRNHPPFLGHRFVGDTSTHLVHDLEREKTTCEIDEIDKSYLKFFEPDTIGQAKLEHFKPCNHCLRFQD